MNNTSEIKPKTQPRNNLNPYLTKPASPTTNHNDFKRYFLKLNIINSFFRNFCLTAKNSIQTAQTTRFCTHALFRRPKFK